MIKNRTVQLIYQTIYVTLGVVGCVACLGIFDNIHLIRWDFYVHFTNISNFLCLGVMLAALIQTAQKTGDSYVSTAPMLKFIGMLGILLTFSVAGILVLVAYTVATKKHWKIPALEILMRACYGIALITGIVIMNVHGIAVLAIIHKACAVLFMALMIILLTHKVITNKKA